jgi:cell division protein FtsL
MLSYKTLSVSTFMMFKQQKTYHTVGTIPKSNIEIVEKGKIDTSKTQIHDCSLSWLETGTSIKSVGVRLV